LHLMTDMPSHKPNGCRTYDILRATTMADKQVI